MGQVWINGRFVEESGAAIPLGDAGLLHGAGVFTTMRADGGRVFRMGRHLERLRGSCGVFAIPLEYDDSQLATAVGGLLERNGLADARLRLTVTRGSRRESVEGAKGAEGGATVPNVFLTTTGLTAQPAELLERGMTVLLLDEQKANPYDAQAGHKTLDYFSRLAALRTAALRSAGEALWFNVHNELQSGSVSNVFIVEKGRMLTPPTTGDLADSEVAAPSRTLRSAVLPGIMRAAVMEWATKAGIEARPAVIDVRRLLDADEVFLTNSIMRVMPVCRIERAVIGDDRPGEVTRRMMGEAERESRRWAEGE